MKEDNTYHKEMEDLNLPETLRLNPFIVPNGYFEELAANITGQAGIEAKIPPEEIPFTTPEGYFPLLTEKILAQTRLPENRSAAEEFSTPEGYFETLTDRIQSRIYVESMTSQDAGFSTPEGYFEGFAERMQAKQSEAELQSKVQTDGFTVPDTYFANLTEQIKAKLVVTTGEASTEERPIVRKLNVQRWIQFAAAASVAIVLGTTSYNAVIDHNQVNATETHLESIPDEEILNYLSSSNNSDDMLYIMEYIYQPEESEGVGSQVKKDDIEDYLNYML